MYNRALCREPFVNGASFILNNCCNGRFARFVTPYLERTLINQYVRKRDTQNIPNRLNLWMDA